jgi:hypothetical protein
MSELSEPQLSAAAVGTPRRGLDDDIVLIARLAWDAIVDITPCANPFGSHDCTGTMPRSSRVGHWIGPGTGLMRP